MPIPLAVRGIQCVFHISRLFRNPHPKKSLFLYANIGMVSIELLLIPLLSDPSKNKKQQTNKQTNKQKRTYQ